MVNYTFSPPSQSVNVGDTILWTNLDNDFHTSTSGNSGSADGLWNSKTLSPNASFSFAFNLAPGSYPYFCLFHYSIGMVGSVTVQAAHVPPSVSIVSPTNGATFPGGSNVLIQASASDSAGTVTQVNFFANGNPVGLAAGAPFTVTMTNPAAGPYALRAVAIDNQGASATSAVVDVTVEASIPQPKVTITNPANGEVFLAGTNILIQASASEIGGAISQVQFFINSNSVAVVTNPPYEYLLTNAAPGNYVLTAEATDVLGATSSSPAITIIVASNPPPTVLITQPTNGALLPSDSSFGVSAAASAQNGEIAQVGFFVAGNSVGVALAPPYETTVSNLAPGIYPLVAEATDLNGKIGTSAVVSITMVGPPTCILTEPAAGAVFPAGSGINLSAAVGTNGASVTNVKFLAGSTVVGQTAAAPYTATWTPSLAGTYLLAAVAFDQFGQARTSAPVSVRAFAPEAGRPSIKITKAPPNSSKLTIGQITIAGTAQDTLGIDQVEFQVNGGPFQAASGSNSWQAEVSLAPGKNAVGFQSVNLAGTSSDEVFRYYTYVVDSLITISVAGPGAVSPALSGKMLVIGKDYELTARAGAGALFVGWSGGLTSSVPRLSFQMQSNLVLTANFVTNPFAMAAGGYSGLILNSNAVFPASAGFLTLEVGNLGAFSGKLAIGGAAYSFHDQFDITGSVTVPVMRPNLVPVALTMQLDLTNASNPITGTATDGTWTSPLLAFRNTSVPAPSFGRLSFMLQNPPANGGASEGQATAIFSRSGEVSVRGSLAGGGKFSFASTLTPQDEFPFYVSLGRGTQVLIGWLQVSGAPATGIAGSVFWTKADTNGFSITLMAEP